MDGPSKSDGNRSFRTAVYEPLLSTWDRRLGTVGVLLSIASLTLSILTLRGSATPTYIVIRDLLIVATVGVVFVVLLIKYVRREAKLQSRQSEIEKLEGEIAELHKQLPTEKTIIKPFIDAHEMVHNFKETLFKKYYAGGPQDKALLVNKDDSDAFENLCSQVTTSVRSTLQWYFTSLGSPIGEDLAVSVKIMMPSAEILRSWTLTEQQKEVVSSKEVWLITAFRDPATYSKFRSVREVGESFYDIHANTAFRVIVEEGKAHYAENNLESLGDAYHNDNNEWRKFYNATLAVPIRYRVPARQIDQCYGLLTVDSLNPQKLDLFNQSTAHVLYNAADLLAAFFLLLEQRDGSTRNRRPSARRQTPQSRVIPVASLEGRVS